MIKDLDNLSKIFHLNLNITNVQKAKKKILYEWCDGAPFNYSYIANDECNFQFQIVMVLPLTLYS